MISGVDLGTEDKGANEINSTASTLPNGAIQIWLDDLKKGKLIATIPIISTEGQNNWKLFSAAINNGIGHDVFIKFVKCKQGNIFVKSIRFSE